MSKSDKYAYRKQAIAAEAYHKAVDLLKVELEIEPNTPIAEENVASINDVRATVEKARQKYDDTSRKHTGARKWLQKLSGHIMYCGRVLDALAQHHPEYVALAWGTVKFVLMVRLTTARAL